MQIEKTNDEKALELHTELMDQYAEAFHKLEDDVLAHLIAEDDSETMSLDEAKQYYREQQCATNN